MSNCSKRPQQYPLRLLAGAKAYKSIRTNGLSAADISAVFGASGAAKWLAIAGLDAAIFSQWLQPASQTITLYGTSIGALKLAAVVQNDNARCLFDLADAYANQRYGEDVSVAAINRETQLVFDKTFDPQRLQHIITHPRFQYNCGAVNCSGSLASDSIRRQVAAMVLCAGRAALGKQHLASALQRVIFCTHNTTNILQASDGISTIHVPLNASNIKDAILASGSIPVYMQSVSLPHPTAVKQTLTLRDGGLLDYHPLPSNYNVNSDGIILYPHFYPHLIEGWFDKHFPWKSPKRRYGSRIPENTLVVTPTKEFVETLPNGMIPDRKDFKTYYKQDDIRIANWKTAIEQSKSLGDGWLQLSESENWADVIELA